MVLGAIAIGYILGSSGSDDAEDTRPKYVRVAEKVRARKELIESNICPECFANRTNFSKPCKSCLKKAEKQAEVNAMCAKGFLVAIVLIFAICAGLYVSSVLRSEDTPAHKDYQDAWGTLNRVALKTIGSPCSSDDEPSSITYCDVYGGCRDLRCIRGVWVPIRDKDYVDDDDGCTMQGTCINGVCF